ncbi:hypothetical protein CHS0354_020756 [Potamilus streckersoni]|uniref:Sulfotransferase n=1 Tax=Potamilus streckersoni TaxID=2493646 RepID=A0AAE0SD11_9BIVA|nr:hypothetical protein CHS0354_020756 [Potamilus streckersoni]
MMSHGPCKRSDWKYSPLDARRLIKLNICMSYAFLCLLTVIFVLVSILYHSTDSFRKQCLRLNILCIQNGHNSIPARTFMWNDTRLDILNMEQFHFDTRFKNPCWFETLISPDPYQRNIYSSYSRAVKRMLEKMTLLWRERLSKNVSSSYRLRCLPYFYIIGQPKCGSTDLFWRISRHPDVVTPPIKELHWWSRGRQGRRVGYSDLIPLGDYIDIFDKVAFLMESHNSSRESRSRPFPLITGEASVSLFWDNPDWYNYPENQHFLEPKYTNPDYIHHLLPDVKLILIVRNPSDRLYSDYLYFHEANKSAEDFHNSVVQTTNLYSNCSRIRSVRECIYDEQLAITAKPGFLSY